MGEKRLSDLAQKQITGKDSLRIINLYESIFDNITPLPEWTEECNILIQSEDGTDYKSTIASLIEHIKKALKDKTREKKRERIIEKVFENFPARDITVGNIAKVIDDFIIMSVENAIKGN